MKWQDSGIILSLKPYSEKSLLVTILTPTQGRYAGLVRVSSSPKNRQGFLPGNFVDAKWQARLPEHLGNWQLETLYSPTARLMAMPERLVALGAACHMAERLLPERNPYPQLYQEFRALLECLVEEPDWLRAYILFELHLLEHTGFGLDLTCCAATGSTSGLIYISPKTGRAVSRTAGLPYVDRLLPLPPPLLGQAATDPEEYREALRVTGYFLNQHLEGGGPLRVRLVDMLRQAGTEQGN